MKHALPTFILVIVLADWLCDLWKNADWSRELQETWKKIQEKVQSSSPEQLECFELYRFDTRVSEMPMRINSLLCAAWMTRFATLTLDKCYLSPSSLCSFSSIQRCVNKLQPRGIAVGRVSFISALERTSMFFPHIQGKLQRPPMLFNLAPFQCDRTFNKAGHALQHVRVCPSWRKYPLDLSHKLQKIFPFVWVTR